MSDILYICIIQGGKQLVNPNPKFELAYLLYRDKNAKHVVWIFLKGLDKSMDENIVVAVCITVSWKIFLNYIISQWPCLLCLCLVIVQ